MGGVVRVDQEQLRAQLEKKLPPKVRLFQLDDIPGVMRSQLGWPVAAALMERWFRGAAFEMPGEMKAGEAAYRPVVLQATHLDENTVSMNWARGFSRVNAGIAKLQSQWATPAGISQLKKLVREQSMAHIATQTWRFGDLAQPAKMLDKTCQVNYLGLGQLSDPLDDFYGAMGEATLKVAVSGLVTPKGSGKATMAIDELGFYLRDSYDFNDGENSFLSQPLGFWGFGGVERVHWGRRISISEQWVREKEEQIMSHNYLVQNHDFRRWRALHSRGGDFIVLSDVHRVRLPFSVQLEW
ncbi:DUF6402 family protein [Paracidovorax cattleyae]|uniref:DUF6402 family protein n=1 Tax=Paracidovorax cattleyae TaxID=80868 RepID=UPI0018AF6723|nr:DUF6402 family protein [Paracidovorax cattleyae]MBF9264860.1 hypothetical protein [Paracidovorax cattleyae]